MQIRTLRRIRSVFILVYGRVIDEHLVDKDFKENKDLLSTPLHHVMDRI